MLHMPTPMLIPQSTGAGQQLFLASGTFVVPPGVTSFSVVCIGAGGASASNRSGGGGALSYVNSYPCLPGEVYAVQLSGLSAVLTSDEETFICAVGDGGSSGGSVLAGTGYAGGAPNTGAANIPRRGGGAAGYTGSGQNSPNTNTDSFGGGGIQPYGSAGGSIDPGLAGDAPNSAGAAYGGGAGKSSPYVAAPGGPGCVRFIWGPGRIFPSNSGDV